MDSLYKQAQGIIGRNQAGVSSKQGHYINISGGGKTRNSGGFSGVGIYSFQGNSINQKSTNEEIEKSPYLVKPKQTNSIGFNSQH